MIWHGRRSWCGRSPRSILITPRPRPWRRKSSNWRKWMNSFASLRVPACILILETLMVLAPAAGQTKRPVKPPKPVAANTEKALVEGTPLDLKKLMLLITAKDLTTGKPLVEDKTIVEAVRKRKLTFVATEDNLATLRQVGAKDHVIEG